MFRRVTRFISQFVLGLNRGANTRHILFATTCAALFALCMIFAWVTFNARRDVSRDVAVAAGNLASAVAHDVDRNFELLDLSLQRVIAAWSDPNFQGLNPSLRQRMLFDGTIAARDTGFMLVLDETGTVRASSKEPNPAPDNFADRDYFRVHVTSGLGLFVSKPFLSRISGKWIVALSRRIDKADGTFGGVALASLQLSYLDQLYSGLNLGTDGTITLFRNDGTVVTRSPYVQSDINRSFRATDGFNRLRYDRSGSFEGELPIDGVRRLISYHQRRQAAADPGGRSLSRRSLRRLVAQDLDRGRRSGAALFELPLAPSSTLCRTCAAPRD